MVHGHTTTIIHGMSTSPLFTHAMLLLYTWSTAPAQKQDRCTRVLCFAFVIKVLSGDFIPPQGAAGFHVLLARRYTENSNEMAWHVHYLVVETLFRGRGTSFLRCVMFPALSAVRLSTQDGPVRPRFRLFLYAVPGLACHLASGCVLPRCVSVYFYD